ncbi:MAG: hypothetical protein IT514_02910 [Burkholderiales bacterium]|nr:hypothetical protein [Burkholderiales bacterium]
MSTVNSSFLDAIERAFDKAFAGRNRSGIPAIPMRQDPIATRARASARLREAMREGTSCP